MASWNNDRLRFYSWVNIKVISSAVLSNAVYVSSEDHISKLYIMDLLPVMMNNHLNLSTVAKVSTPLSFFTQRCMSYLTLVCFVGYYLGNIAVVESTGLCDRG